MLTKKDIEIIEEAASKTSKKVIIEFWEQILEPYLTKEHEVNKSEHQQMVTEIKSLRNQTEEIKEYIKDHDKRIETLEKVALKN